MVSFAHQVASAGKYIAIASTTVETSNPVQELKPGLDLLGKILERWVWIFFNLNFFYPFSILRFDSVSDLLAPVGDGSADNCYISKSYDATSHFETAADDVLSLYRRITGTSLDMNISADMNEDEDA